MKTSTRLLPFLLAVSLSGCLGPTASPTSSSSPLASGTPSQKVTPPPATPGQFVTTEVKVGEGGEIDPKGGMSIEIKVWSDKFEGQPLGPGRLEMTLTPDKIPLPGLTSTLKGMKKGGVKRVEIAAGDLFAELPPGSGLTPTSRLFLEVTLKDLYPEEPFEIKTTKQGTGKAAEVGDALRVHYIGRTEGFDSPKVFDSSRENGVPYVVVLGNGNVIAGWEKGLLGIKKGETRRLSIPHYLAYGEKAQDGIPAKSRLFFEVELLDFVTPGKLQKTTVTPGKGKALESGQTGVFEYTGWLDGFKGKRKFDSSSDKNRPLPVQIGVGQVIAGWDEGLVGMKPGEVRQLEVPYNLAYGVQGRPPVITPYSTLFFEVKYLGLESDIKPAEPQTRGLITPTPKP